MKTDHGMTLIVKTVTRISVWLIVLYGIYIILHGHLTPGGGFGGGVILSLAFLNVMLAYGKEFTLKWLDIHLLHRLEGSSVMLFMIVGLLGIVAGGGFWANIFWKGKLFDLLSAGTIPVLNIFIGIKVGVSLFLAVWLLTQVKLEEGGKK